MDVWKDLYYDCLSVENNFNTQIKEHQKAILRLQKEMEKNRKFFKKNFDLSLDKCANMYYLKISKLDIYSKIFQLKVI